MDYSTAYDRIAKTVPRQRFLFLHPVLVAGKGRKGGSDGRQRHQEVEEVNWYPASMLWCMLSSSTVPFLFFFFSFSSLSFPSFFFFSEIKSFIKMSSVAERSQCIKLNGKEKDEEHHVHETKPQSIGTHTHTHTHK